MATGRRRRVRAPIPLLCLALLVGCTDPGDPDRRDADGVTPVDPQDAAVAMTFGYGPDPDGGAVYQPDVVLIEGGPAAVLHADDSGLVWTMDATAPGIADLTVGSVMFATSRAVGRVVDLRDEGDARVVTLGPVDLTEVVSDAVVDVNLDVDPSQMTFQHVPGMPGAAWDPEPAEPAEESGTDDAPADASADTTTSGAARTVLAVAAPVPRARATTGRLPPAVEHGKSLEVPVGDWKVTVSKASDEVGLALTRDGPLKAAIELAFTGSDIRVESHLTVVSGQTTESTFLLTGITGLRLDIAAGVPAGTEGNASAVLEIPSEINVELPPSPATAGLPLNLKLSFKVSISTALTGTNATLLAAGSYRLAGPIGIQDGEIVGPTFEVDRSILESLEAVTLGPSGLVVAGKLEAAVGFGVPVAQVGPYGGLITSVGLTHGSSLGAPLVECRRGTLQLTVAAGVGIELSAGLSEALAQLLPAKTKLELRSGGRRTILTREQTMPESAACR